MKKNLMKKNKQIIIKFLIKTKKINKINRNKKLIKVYLQRNNKI